MKIIVTGGSGYLGTHVRNFFEADDFSRRSYLDVVNPSDAKIVSEYDVVIHLAAFLDKDPANAYISFQTNADGTANILRNMKPNSVFIYASTKDVYGANAENYAEVPEACHTSYCGQSALEWSKLIGERYVDYYAAERDIRACIFRLSTVYAPATEGNESGFVSYYVDAVRNGSTLSLPGGGKPVRDLLHVNDFSAACKAFIDSEVRFGLYNLGGGSANAVSLVELVQLIGSLTGIEPILDSGNQTMAPVPFHYVSDLSRVTNELGWAPRIDNTEGIKGLL
jgi:nucleoside-diphosphate-sugar epimerase